MTTTTVDSKRSSRSKRSDNEITRRRNHPLRRIFRFIRSTWWIFLIVALAYFSYTSQDFLNVLLLILSFAFRMLFAIAFIVIQFVALFSFMARSKVEVITPEDSKTLTFDDYKGQERLLELVKQWMSLLSDRSKFRQMGGEYINGLLFYGPPGTGKTMLAKCMAGEAGTAFISIEGSGFRAMFWGVDVLKMIRFIARARKLAREYGACIAFIDEIDAVGASRGNVMGGRQMGMGAGMGGMMGGGTGALTRLLYEMDGVGEKTRMERFLGRLYKLIGKEPPERNWHVLFVGSTNRPDTLDPALTRPGRFDRKIEVAPPDRVGRRAVIEYYLGKIKHDDSVDIEAIVADTNGYTPAQIMSAITKDAVRLALFDGRDLVKQRDIDMAFQEQLMGLENPIEDMQEDQRVQVAYHEAGHAVAMYYLLPEMRIVRATIIRRSNALGYVLPSQKFDLHAAPLSWYVKRIMVSLAGDEAVKIWSGGEPWTGKAGDFQNVRNMIQALAAEGFFGPPIHDPKTLQWDVRDAQNQFTGFWGQAEESTQGLLREHWDEVHAIAQALLHDGDLSGKEIVKIIQDITGVDIREGDEEKVDELIAEGAMAAAAVSENGQPTSDDENAKKPARKKEASEVTGD